MLGVGRDRPWVQMNGPMVVPDGVEGESLVGFIGSLETGEFLSKTDIDNPPGPSTLSSRPARWASFSPLCWAPVIPYV